MDHLLDKPLYWPCIILRSQLSDDGSYLYIVHMHKVDDDESNNSDKNKTEEINVVSPKQPTENLIAENIPQAALRFFDLSYTDDTFLPNAFRHDIRIPNDIFPQIWKNIKE